MTIFFSVRSFSTLTQSSTELYCSVEDCVKVEKERTLKKIVKSPADFYVNVHDDEFPEGAIRGQLKVTGPQQ